MKSLTDKYWSPPVCEKPAEKTRSLSEKLGISIEIAQILQKKGIEEEADILSFLYPKLKNLPSPFLYKNMDKACRVILEHLQKGGEIIVWGDYDVDGITATTLLVRFFRLIGHDVRYHIPNRFSEGYGLNKTSLSQLIHENTKEKLIITVDCGITSFAEIEFLAQEGCKIVVTDHHEPDAKLPDAEAVLNGKQDGCEFPDKNLAGVAVAFYLIAGLRASLAELKYFRDKNGIPPLKPFLEFVAIGTVADMVPVTDVNRTLVRAGFEIINSTPSCGIAALLKECDIFSGNISSEDIAFHIAPMINAAGRMADGSIAAELLLQEDEQEAQKLARRLALLNSQRKEECAESLENTLSCLDEEAIRKSGILIKKIDCSLGIIGIVASQLTGILGVPVILVTEGNDRQKGAFLKGSCRSVEGVNIYDVLQHCRDLLVTFGGHPMAAGISINMSDIQAFEEKAQKYIEDLEITRFVHNSIDYHLPIERALNTAFLRDYMLLEPFGPKNEKPVFFSENAVVQDVRRIGRNGNHLSFCSRGRFENNRCIAFNLGECERYMYENPTCNIVYSLTMNRFKRNVNWQARVIDII